MLLTAGGLSFLYTSTPPTRAAAPATTTGMATSASSPDFEAWDAAVKSHVSSSEIRGIRLNSVDYQGIDLVDVAVAVAVVVSAVVVSVAAASAAAVAAAIIAGVAVFLL